MPRITKSYVEKLPHTEKGQKFYPCSDLPGFLICVGQKSKTYYAQKDVNGKTIRVVIGKHGVFTPEQARDEAKELLVKMSKGINPNKEKKLAKERSTTLKEAVEAYKEGRKDLSKATLYRLEALERLYFPDWMNTELREITKEMVFKRHLKLGDERGSTTANKMMQAIRAIYNFALKKDETLPPNPVSALSSSRSWYKEKRRRTVIKPNELKPWYDAVMLLENITIRDYLRLILFTGMRREEGLTLMWKNVDFKERTILIPDTKNGKPLELPMSDYIFAMLEERRKRDDKSEYVFTSKTSATGHLAEPRKGMIWVTEKSGVEFMLHDLRRTFVTIAESIDIPAYAIKALVNHSMDNDVTAGYIIMTVDRLREPMQKVADKILGLANKPEEKAAA